MVSGRREPTQTRKLPTRGEAMLFSAKALGLRVERWAHDLRGEARRWPLDVSSNEGWFAGAESRTALWCEDDPREQALERGKVANLQVACARLDCVTLDAGGVFSFWRQMGRAGKRQGFTQGRMLQQGCLIASVGGGLCQLSNALYELALLSGCEIVERHAHSARLPHMPLHDATVAWNYVDLRFRVRERTRVRASVTTQELVVAFEGNKPAALSVVPTLLTAREAVGEMGSSSGVRSCASCGETACFRHMKQDD